MHWPVFCAGVVGWLDAVLRLEVGAAGAGAAVATGDGRLRIIAATAAFTWAGLTRKTHPALLIVLPSVGISEKVILPADISPNSVSSDRGSRRGSISTDERTAFSNLVIVAGWSKVPADAIFLMAWLRK